MLSKNFNMLVIAVLTVALGGFAYIYLNVIPKKGGGGIVIAAASPNVDTGSIRFLFSVHGPGKGKFPRLVKPMSVATDKQKNIYVADSDNNRVVVFNSQGEFMFEFGKYGNAYPDSGEKSTWEPGQFNYPYGIDIDKDTGNIFVADMSNRRVQIFDSSGNFLDWFPKEPYGGQASDIFPLALDVEQGKVYITNPYQVLIFDTKGNFIKDFGMPGTQDGQFDRPNGIAVGKDGTIYISDSNNLRLQAFTPDGEHKWTFGKKVGIEDNEGREFGLPRNIAMGPDGNIYVVDAFHFTIQVFSPDGKRQAEMGQRGVDGGTFNYPNGIAITDDKTIYIADKENNRVQAIRLDKLVIEKQE